MGTRHYLALLDDLPAQGGAEFIVEGRVLAVFRSAAGLFAIDGICPHAGGPLVQGMLRGNVVTCPWHGWQFDVKTGRHCLNARLQQPTFPVTVEQGRVYVEFSEPDALPLP